MESCPGSQAGPGERTTSGVLIAQPASTATGTKYGYRFCAYCGKLLKLRARRLPSHGRYLSTVPEGRRSPDA